MPVVVVRIDDRLVHGQIVQGWLKNINIDVIVVVSDAVAKDPMQQMLMSMAMPSSTRLEVKNVNEAGASLAKGAYEKDKTMILVSNPADILKMIELGADFKSVNVGGMHFVPGKRQLLCNLSVDDDDVKNLYAIYSKGIEIEGRVLPLDDRLNIIPIIEKEYKGLK
ncbi:PTS system mannose/fructose/N-acetylgalactosamine-transporter subunit IIB [Endomicrobium proavitum]|uniref:PTS mannose/fructose/N-acetylgalactosamine-specific component IIB n=1 Tax=Endomicrobium proavitum TaxID=1408281 RepID=A0A0G3WJ39_9BACT|nr:PTS sugar transporter subunit IIB [Endomicrobium proavitum]AKL97469.1 PTS mannose/fructose/N-acetylgalactosamine-specific component IIB [Endomicrobium proavitum]